MPEIVVGDCVSLKSGLSGTIKYKGEVGFAEGEWYGIALTTPDGTNDGYIPKEKRRYFKTKQRHGIFIKYDKISSKLENPPDRSSWGRKTDRTEKIIRSQSKERNQSQEIWLNYLHEKVDRFYPKVIFQEHFITQRNKGNRRGFDSPRILDLREWIVKQTFGKNRSRKLNEVKVYLEEEDRRQLEDKEKLITILGKRVMVLIESKSPNEDMIHVNRVYRLVDGRVGQCLFKGRTRFAKGNWIGIALFAGEGNHDGSVYGKRYFRARNGKGIFVRPWKVKEEVLDRVKKGGEMLNRSLAPTEAILIKNQLLKEAKQKSGAEEPNHGDRGSVDFGAENVWEPADYNLEPSHDSGMKPKLLYLEKELRKNYGIAADKKMTITEFEEWCKSGKNEKAIEEIMAWKRAEFNVDNLFETNRYDISVPASKLHKNDGEKAPRKLGPTAIGTAKGYKPAQFTSTCNIRYDISYTLKELNKTKGQQADKKLGPQDIGKMTSFQPANFNISNEDIRYDLTYTKTQLDKNAGKKIEPKLGPKQIGRNDDYEVPEYDIEVSNVRYDLFYLISKLKDGEGIKPKLGPRDIGINKDFHRPKYKLNTEEVRMDLYHSMKELKKNEHCRAPKRQRVRSIGFAKGFNPFKSSWDDKDGEHSTPHLYYAKKKGRERKCSRKLGPVEIGRAHNFTPYRVPTQSRAHEKEEQSAGFEKSNSFSPENLIEPRGHSIDSLPSAVLRAKTGGLGYTWFWSDSCRKSHKSHSTNQKVERPDVVSSSHNSEFSETSEMKSSCAETKRTSELLTASTCEKDARGKGSSSQRKDSALKSKYGSKNIAPHDEQTPTKRGSVITRRRFKISWNLFCRPSVN